MRDLLGSWKTSFGFLACALIAVGVYFSTQSEGFLLKVVQVEAPENRTPISIETMVDWINVPVEKIGLFALDLNRLRDRMEEHPWVREAVVRKVFPSTVSIQAKMRQPIAVFRAKGKSRYIDRDGIVFGQFKLAHRYDLPVISSTVREETRDYAVSLVNLWSKHFDSDVELGAISWSEERGFQAAVSVKLDKEKVAPLVLELGPDEGVLGDKLRKLATAIQELKRRRIMPRQIFVADRQKIVVKTARHF